eukprot:14298207-Ditylum_brightwellii.AAC.1
MEEINTVYNNRGFNNIEIHCNNELHASVNAYLLNNIQPAKMNHDASKEHIPRAAINSRTIQE